MINCTLTVRFQAQTSTFLNALNLVGLQMSLAQLLQLFMPPAIYVEPAGCTGRGFMQHQSGRRVKPRHHVMTAFSLVPTQPFPECWDCKSLASIFSSRFVSIL